MSTGQKFTPRSNRADRFDTPLPDRDVALIFKRLALVAGIDAQRISGHSTRVGAKHGLPAANFITAEIMRQRCRKTEPMIVRYGEHLAARRCAMALLVKGRRGGTPVNSI